MSNGTVINPGVGGDKVFDVDGGDGFKYPVSALMTLTDGAPGILVSPANPMPMRQCDGTGFITPLVGGQLPSGLGQLTMAASLSVAIASNQSAIPVSVAGTVPVTAAQFPAVLVGGRLDANIGAWLGSTAPTVGSKTSANSLPVVIASDQGAVPVSGTVAVSGTVPVSSAQLPATLGQKAMAASAAVVLASDQSSIPVTVGGTVPVSIAGTVAISAAALPALSGTTAVSIAGTVATSATQLPAALVGGRLDGNVGTWLGSTAPTVGSKTSVNSVPVVIASDQGNVPVTLSGSPAISGTVTSNQGTPASLANRWPVQVSDGTNALPTADAAVRALFARCSDGTNTAAVKAASTAAAAADPALVVAISPNNTLPTNQTQLNGVAALAGNGVTGTGSPRVTIASDNTAFQVKATGNAGAAFDAATAAAVPANALFNGLRAATANPANATGGNMVGQMGDKAGRAVVTPCQVRELVAVQQTAIASTTETTIVTAGAAGVFNDIIGIVITTAGAAAQTITIKDATAGTARMVLNYPNAAVAPGAPLTLMFPVPIPQAAAAANWTATQSLATACNYTVLYAKNL
jgi:hypothetical protein